MHVIGVHFRTMSHATEDEDRVAKALGFASGAEAIERDIAKGHFGNQIVILEATLKRSAEVKQFLSSLAQSGIADVLAGELEQRMDHDCVLHFRLDKQAAYLGRLELAGTKDVIDCSMKIAAYPASKEKALITARECFDALGNLE